MPTYKNNSEQLINYETGGKIYSFPANKETGTNICVPYKELGLELIDENYPPVKSKVLISGTFKFSAGMERKINIPHCNKYRIKVSVKSGRLKQYLGSSGIGIELTGDNENVYEWGYAPYIRLLGLETGTEASVYGELVEE